MHKEITELLGTLIFVLLGAGAASMADAGTLGTALAIGISWMAASYITGADLNPAVTFGKLMGGDVDVKDCLRTVIAQIIGAAGAVYLLGVIGGDAGANAYADGAETGTFLTEAIATCLFVLLVSRVAANKALAGIGGLVTGLGLALTVMVAGTTVNPAESIATAGFAGGTALEQLWMFIVAPAVGATVASMIVKNGILDAPKKAAKKKK